MLVKRRRSSKLKSHARNFDNRKVLSVLLIFCIDAFVQVSGDVITHHHVEGFSWSRLRRKTGMIAYNKVVCRPMCGNKADYGVGFIDY